MKTYVPLGFIKYLTLPYILCTDDDETTSKVKLPSADLLTFVMNLFSQFLLQIGIIMNMFNLYVGKLHKNNLVRDDSGEDL